MDNQISKVVIVGGGTAGWLTAALLAAEHNLDQGLLSTTPKLQITLIESPDVAIIGVGEGTWPSMRATLQKIGLSETEFLIECEASFKQGSQFINWCGSKTSDSYLHPFTLPVGTPELNIASYWLPFADEVAFAEAVSPQQQLCAAALAPKLISTAQYSFINNYGYHLNAGKFGALLQRHAVSKLGVEHKLAHITAIKNHSNGDIATVLTSDQQEIAGDLFIDCSGLKSMLLGQHLQVPLLARHQVLFNDTALAVQVPYTEPEQDIASVTLSTAQSCGWIWDIGLPSRRGVGHVYSSAHQTEQQAEQQLRQYLSASVGQQVADQLEPRKLSIRPGYRQSCWVNNCVAIGMAAGFIEPLEASALALVEWTAKTLSSQFPVNKAVMPLLAKRMNDSFNRHWQQIIEFLKLHYVLSQRADNDYWHDHRKSSSIPEHLQQLLELWRYQVPGAQDFPYSDQLFPAASYQYVLYGMGFKTQAESAPKASLQRKAQQLFQDNYKRTQSMKAQLSSNRDLLNKIAEFGLPKL